MRCLKKSFVMTLLLTISRGLPPSPARFIPAKLEIMEAVELVLLPLLAETTRASEVQTFGSTIAIAENIIIEATTV
jgi:hypothetical protein